MVGKDGRRCRIGSLPARCALGRCSHPTACCPAFAAALAADHGTGRKQTQPAAGTFSRLSFSPSPCLRGPSLPCLGVPTNRSRSCSRRSRAHAIERCVSKEQTRPLTYQKEQRVLAEASVRRLIRSQKALKGEGAAPHQRWCQVTVVHVNCSLAILHALLSAAIDIQLRCECSAYHTSPGSPEILASSFMLAYESGLHSKRTQRHVHRKQAGWAKAESHMGPKGSRSPKG